MKDSELLRRLRKSEKVLRHLDIDEITNLLFAEQKRLNWDPQTTVCLSIKADELHIVAPADHLWTQRSAEEFAIAQLTLVTDGNKDYQQRLKQDLACGIFDTLLNIEININAIKKGDLFLEAVAKEPVTVSLEYVIEDASEIEQKLWEVEQSEEIDILDYFRMLRRDMGVVIDTSFFSGDILESIEKNKATLSQIDPAAVGEFMLQKEFPSSGKKYDVYLKNGTLRATSLYSESDVLCYDCGSIVLLTVDDENVDVAEYYAFKLHSLGIDLTRMKLWKKLDKALKDADCLCSLILEATKSYFPVQERIEGHLKDEEQHWTKLYRYYERDI